MPLIALHTLDTALPKQCRQGSKSCQALFFPRRLGMHCKLLGFYFFSVTICFI
jgi:hypothetical protein